MAGGLSRVRSSRPSLSRSVESAHPQPNESQQQPESARRVTRSHPAQPQSHNVSSGQVQTPLDGHGDSNRDSGDNSLRVDTPEVGSSASPEPTGSNIRRRGPTVGLSLCRIQPGQRVQVELAGGVPIAPNEAAKQFTTQACVWMKQSWHIPLEIKSFKEVSDDAKDRFWSRLKDKFEIFHSEVPPPRGSRRTSAASPAEPCTPQEPSTPVESATPASSSTPPSTSTTPSTTTQPPLEELSTRLPPANNETKKKFFQWMARRLKDRRHMLHTVHYQKYTNDEDRLENPPQDVNGSDWHHLVRYFGSPEFKAMSERNKKNRSKLDAATTTAGPCSFVRKRRKMTDENDGVQPDDVTFFEVTHRRKDGTPVDGKAAQLIDEMAEINQQVTQGSCTRLHRLR